MSKAFQMPSQRLCIGRGDVCIGGCQMVHRAQQLLPHALDYCVQPLGTAYGIIHAMSKGI